MHIPLDLPPWIHIQRDQGVSSLILVFLLKWVDTGTALHITVIRYKVITIFLILT